MPVGVARPDAALSAVEMKAVGGEAGRHTGITACAMRPIKMWARAAKSNFGQLAVGDAVHRSRRIDEQSGGLLLGKVAACMRVCREDLEGRKNRHRECLFIPSLGKSTSIRSPTVRARRVLLAIANNAPGRFRRRPLIANDRCRAGSLSRQIPTTAIAGSSVSARF